MESMGLGKNANIILAKSVAILVGWEEGIKLPPLGERELYVVLNEAHRKATEGGLFRLPAENYYLPISMEDELLPSERTTFMNGGDRFESDYFKIHVYGRDEDSLALIIEIEEKRLFFAGTSKNRGRDERMAFLGSIGHVDVAFIPSSALPLVEASMAPNKIVLTDESKEGVVQEL